MSYRTRAAARPPYTTKARFASTCPETGKAINPGDTICYSPATRQAFHQHSQQAEEVRAREFAASNGMADANY